MDSMTAFHLQRPPLAASLLALCGVGVLCGLGTWQVNRLAEKEAFLRQLKAEAEQPASALSFQDFTPATLYKRGTLRGHWLSAGTVALIPRTYEGRPGAHLYTPLKLKGGEIVLVNRGWVPDSYQDTALPRGPVTIRGEIIHLPRPNPFTPPNPETKETSGARRWYRLDEAALKTLFPGTETVAPVMLRAENAQEDGVRPPVTKATEIQINNNHAAYAAFWYGMALVLSAVFFLRFMVVKGRR
jgi:surfeit locus 1 family protein